MSRIDNDLATVRPIFRAIAPYQLTIKPINVVTAVSTPQVDLRPRIAEFGLGIRSQGGRGTCSVFAVTFALEFLYRSRLGVTVNDLSEEYLNYTSNLVLGQFNDGDFFSNIDAGYREWGMVPEARVPYESQQITTLDQAILNEGRGWTRFVADFIKPWDAATGATQAQVDQAVAYLDAQTPVCFGGWWPDSTLAATTQVNGVDLMTVPPTSKKGSGMFDGHSVTLVGYRRDASFPGGGYFVFRNHWGSGWGDQGYGYMPFEYVRQYANDLLAYRTKAIKAKPGSPVGVVRRSDSIDVVVTDEAGEVHAAAWEQGMMAGQWRGWWSVLKGRGAPGAPVGIVSRATKKLDAFVAGTDGKTYTAAWDANVANGAWRGWWNILGGAIPSGGAVTVVSRAPDKLDVFLVSTDGGVYTAAWEQNVAKGAWRGWWRIGTLTAKPGSLVSAVARDANKLDVFVAGTDGKTYTAAWDANVANGAWRGWWNILGGAIPSGGAVSVVSRAADKLDVFLVSTDGGIYTAAWEQNVANGAWRGWWRIGTLTAKPGALVSAVARDATKLDVFVAGTDGKTYTAAWDANVANGAWRGWWNILGGAIPSGGAVTAVSRAADKLDVFLVSTDGAVYTAAWQQNVANGAWRGWWRIG